MRFYTKPHKHYCGIDLHARTMFVCILDAQGNILLERNIPADPAKLLRLLAPFRDDLAIAVECCRRSRSAGSNSAHIVTVQQVEWHASDRSSVTLLLVLRNGVSRGSGSWLALERSRRAGALVLRHATPVA